MLLLDATNPADYLRERGRIGPTEQVRVEELSGGVSNIVLLVTRPECGESFVLKQAREQLRVPDPWFCGVERIWREVEVLRVCESALLTDMEVTGKLQRPAFAVSVPRVLFEDRKEFLFAMTAAPGQPWKAELMAGRCDCDVAHACGLLLGRLHAGTWHNEKVSEVIGEQKFFDALRVDPYYRHIALAHSDLSGDISELIESMQRHRHCLVHGDFSPKNLMLAREPSLITLIDCEVGHYGDPAFDLGFILSHFVLKAFRTGLQTAGSARALPGTLELADIFLHCYPRAFPLLPPDEGSPEAGAAVTRGMLHLAGCLLARIDGKSRVDYLPEVRQHETVRKLARALFAARPADWGAARLLIEHALDSLA
jgi:tRNA A-37 threonylcarbamoyl transferase component Bud32